jgi:hypothetical protein
MAQIGHRVRFRSVGFSHRHETTSAGSRALASLIWSSEAAIDAYLMLALTEAKALNIRRRDAVLSIANTLMVHRTLDAVMIHEIIALAPEARAAGRLGADVRERAILLSWTVSRTV